MTAQTLRAMAEGAAARSSDCTEVAALPTNRWRLRAWTRRPPLACWPQGRLTAARPSATSCATGTPRSSSLRVRPCLDSTLYDSEGLRPHAYTYFLVVPHTSMSIAIFCRTSIYRVQWMHLRAFKWGQWHSNNILARVEKAVECTVVHC